MAYLFGTLLFQIGPMINKKNYPIRTRKESGQWFEEIDTECVGFQTAKIQITRIHPCINKCHNLGLALSLEI